MKKTKELTRKQNLVLETIRISVEQEFENPTAYKIHNILKEEGHDVGVLKGTVQVIEALEKRGLIKRDKKKKIYLVKNEDFSDLKNIFSVPVFGLASCGEALAFADDNMEGYLQVSKSLFKKEKPVQLFAVKALGDSMNKADINDGDYVVFKKHEYGEDLDGKIVVIVINGMATIKKYKTLKNKMIVLFPESSNPIHQPIYLDESDKFLVAGIFRKILPVTYVAL
ncbi:MAG: S24 family peptidase [Candidatus Caldatribacteriota bacterium]|nr:S24 family peptidase [Candidatus Caldatribacteriota bacterium]